MMSLGKFVFMQRHRVEHEETIITSSDNVEKERKKNFLNLALMPNILRRSFEKELSRPSVWYDADKSHSSMTLMKCST